jgi:hypothetical protein
MSVCKWAVIARMPLRLCNEGDLNRARGRNMRHGVQASNCENAAFSSAQLPQASHSFVWTAPSSPACVTIEVAMANLPSTAFQTSSVRPLSPHIFVDGMPSHHTQHQLTLIVGCKKGAF